jgi:type II secretory pathway component PulF
MEFKYTAQDKEGRRITERIHADSVPQAISRLKNLGLIPLEVKAIRGRSVSEAPKPGFLSGNKVHIKDLAVFTRQLSSSLKAGILLAEALQTLASDWHDPYFRGILQKITDDIRAGVSFSAALSKYPNVFDQAYVYLTKAGEASGDLANIMANLAKYLENTYKNTQKLKAAIRYPLFILGFFVFTVFVVVFLIIPKFKCIFANSNMRLPLLTSIVVGISEFAIKHFIIFGIGVLVMVAAVFSCLKISKLRFYFDRKILEAPVVGDIIKKTLISRFARTLSILISGGVGLVTALDISSQVSANSYIKAVVDSIKDRVISGFTLSNEMSTRPLFQKMFVKMVQVGEKTGKISEMFKQNAEYYDEELEYSISNFIALIEPCLIVLIGGLVLVVVLALYLPIFNMAMLKR